jgi:hypothetical protein
MDKIPNRMNRRGLVPFEKNLVPPVCSPFVFFVPFVVFP